MDAKHAAQALAEGAREHLVGLSHRIHGLSETAFEEEQSSAACAEMLTAGGFAVEGGVAGLPTAFRATAGSGPLNIAICAEYDALPGIGHACGHNVIAAAAVGAGLALAEVADEVGLTVTVMGTPAEESGGGKIIMLDAGAFDGVHASMMVHPSPVENERMECLAVSHFEVQYHGKTAHASAWPEVGINAADALTVAQVGIGLLRQHIRQTDRVHGIVVKGGDAPNIVPHDTRGKWYARSSTLKDLAVLEPRVRACFEAGALATGCTVEFRDTSKAYSEFDHDLEMVALYRANAEALGRVFPDIPDAVRKRSAGSTDMANVSLAMPSIHPMLGLDSLPASNHQPEFTAYCATPTADKAAVDGAIAMAWTCIDMATSESVRTRLLAGAAAV